jgi:hypothetical protein
MESPKIVIIAGPNGADNFAFETTLSGLGYLRRIREWRLAGYHVSLFFLSRPSADLAIARVAERVSTTMPATSLSFLNGAKQHESGSSRPGEGQGSPIVVDRHSTSGSGRS